MEFSNSDVELKNTNTFVIPESDTVDENSSETSEINHKEKFFHDAKFKLVDIWTFVIIASNALQFDSCVSILSDKETDSEMISRKLGLALCFLCIAVNKYLMYNE